MSVNLSPNKEVSLASQVYISSLTNAAIGEDTGDIRCETDLTGKETMVQNNFNDNGNTMKNINDNDCLVSTPDVTNTEHTPPDVTNSEHTPPDVTNTEHTPPDVTNTEHTPSDVTITEHTPSDVTNSEHTPYVTNTEHTAGVTSTEQTPADVTNTEHTPADVTNSEHTQDVNNTEHTPADVTNSEHTPIDEHVPDDTNNEHTPLDEHAGGVTNTEHTADVKHIAGVTNTEHAPAGVIESSIRHSDYIYFSNVLYLGSSTVDAPMSKIEANRSMHILKNQIVMQRSPTFNSIDSEAISADPSSTIPVVLYVPKHPAGTLQLLEPRLQTPLISYKINQVLFCCRGVDEGIDDCFAFNIQHTNGGASIFHCHIVQMKNTNEATKLVKAFRSAFQRNTKPNVLPARKVSLTIGAQISLLYELSLQIQECYAGQDSWSHVIFDKGGFKLQIGAKYKFKVKIVIKDSTSEDYTKDVVRIERCFSMLLNEKIAAAAVNDHEDPAPPVFDNPENSNDSVISQNEQNSPGSSDSSYLSSFQPKHSQSSTTQMCPLIIISQEQVEDGVLVEAVTASGNIQLISMAEETTKNAWVWLSLCIDVLFEQISPPVRFVKEFKVRMVRSEQSPLFNNLFSSMRNKVSKTTFSLLLTPNQQNNEHLTLVSISPLEETNSFLRHRTSTEELDRGSKTNLRDMPGILDENDILKDMHNQEPLLSGSGQVETEISTGTLESWDELQERWNWKEGERPKLLLKLVRQGIPEKYRCLVWPQLTGAHLEECFSESYRLLITESTETDYIIEWDIKRTFTAHDFFRDNIGQSALLNLSKAYASFDKEIGYCQGFSFIMAVLLLHLPEEQAFASLIKIMFDYGMRELFRQGFELLKLKLFQLEKLIEEFLPDIYLHFKTINIETHMFASQWFLTVFVAKFPLNLAYRIFDIFLTDYLDQTIFSFSLAFLKHSKKEILSFDFENVLQFFRVTLPRKYLDDNICLNLVELACTYKINIKKLKKIEKDYKMKLEAESQEQDPVVRLEREVKSLRDEKTWLHQENNDLAHELVSSKVKLRDDLDVLEDKIIKKCKDLKNVEVSFSELSSDLEATQSELKISQEETLRWRTKYEEEKQHSEHTIAEYKDIMSRMDETHQREISDHKQQIVELKKEKVQLASQSIQRMKSPEMDPTRDKITEEDIEKTVVNDANRLQEVEMELAKTKLELCEAHCQLQDLRHQLSILHEEIPTNSNNAIILKYKKLTGLK